MIVAVSSPDAQVMSMLTAEPSAAAQVATSLTTLFAGCPRLRLLPGRCLFRRGDPAEAVFLIDQGELRMLRHLATGEGITVRKGAAGDLFAEGALFSSVYHCDGVASEVAIVAACEKSQMLAALERTPSLALEMLQRVTRELHIARTLLELRNVRSAKDRVLQHLRLHADQAGVARFRRPLLENAADVGLTPEAYYRGLAALARNGEVKRAGRTICVAGRTPEEDRP